MRVLTIKLDSIYSFSSDSEEEKAIKFKRRADRADALAEVGITINKKDDGDYVDDPTLSVTETQYIDLLQRRIEIGRVLSVTEMGSGVDPNGAIKQVEHLIGKMEKFAQNVSNLQYNEKVEVYTPGMGLMLFNRVMLLQDACSDALQTELDNGWKIIAACPQPDQRRPDYIMGRYDPAYAENDAGARNSALRG